MNPPRFLTVTDLSSSEIHSVVERASAMKSGSASNALSGRTVALLFEKPSLRTRGSFEVGIHQLGGHCFYTGGQEVGLGVREPVSDVAKVLSRYVDGIVARVNSHEALKEFAACASVMVVNALSDWEHPCQTLADLQTINEAKGRLSGLRGGLHRRRKQRSAQLGPCCSFSWRQLCHCVSTGVPVGWRQRRGSRWSSRRSRRATAAAPHGTRRSRCGCRRGLYGCLGQHG